ncbi:hypothetical protein TSUD_145610 [Trifolium subterraneum]|uniref:Reverse transcriptase domain-containing protein n=1 Tax=Trifolium subterraneum TaxID=3900 RepID=A0A2Z6NRT8_TRISU|nr:hypothetical protein TSUD_145610 [Trifolium subterraneum]
MSKSVEICRILFESRMIYKSVEICRWVENVYEVRVEIVDYFTNHFSESVDNRPTLDGIEFQVVDPVDVLALTVPFTTSEIEEVVLSSDGDKSPGPDGFNFSFFKSFWGLLKGDVGIGDFRPISLVGSLYKIVVKVLARRLAKVMDKLISSNQYAFIKGRQLVDEVVAINEIIDLAKKSRKECLIFKVDFEMAYDSVSWSFLDYMMTSPTEAINIQRGLKQGDPLAPFLFLLVVEGLSGAIKSAEQRNMFKGFQVGNTGLSVSHLNTSSGTSWYTEDGNIKFISLLRRKGRSPVRSFVGPNVVGVKKSNALQKTGIKVTTMR